MVNDAESHANEDERRKELAEARNQADHPAYQIEKQLAEHGDKLTDDEKAPIEDKVTDGAQARWPRMRQTEDLKAATNELLTASQVLGQKIYEQAAAEAEGARPSARRPARRRCRRGRDRRRGR